MRSRIEYAKEFAACEAEELRVTGRVQNGLSLVAIGDDGSLSVTPDLLKVPDQDLRAMATAAAISSFGGVYDLITGTDGFEWVRHRLRDQVIAERPRLGQSNTVFPELDWSGLKQSARGNLWKLSYAICKEAAEALNTDRAMVYRFHHDWSGEVIAEVTTDGFEPYLGLHYPPTDIPKQARELYLETKSRQIFSTDLMDQPLESISDFSAKVDLSGAIGRSCSPYHLEYLKNMGSGSTSSCALIYQGKLWGLLSLHYARSRTPSLAEFAFLQSAADGFSAALSQVLTLENKEHVRRAQRVKSEFATALDHTSDPFHALVLSRSALHRMVGASGLCLQLGDDICRVGHVPDTAVTEAIIASVGEPLDPMSSVFLDRLPSDIPEAGRHGIAGVSVTKITNDPPSFAITFRKSQEQTVSWGGDPRRVAQDDELRRVSPRRSFEQWVERVTGCSAPWTAAQEQTIHETLAYISEYFGASDREIALLIKNGLRQASRQKDLVRANAVDLIDGMKTAIAVCVETAGNANAQIVAFNAAASEAFAVSPAEISALGLDSLERIAGVELSNVSDSQFTATIATANAGIRECEINVGLIFEYVRKDRDDSVMRVQIFEFRDVTEARRIEQALVAARDRARADMKLRQEFFAKLAHELKTPLNALVGLSSLLQSDAEKFDSKTAKRIEVMAAASNHMAEVVDSTLQNAMAAQSVANDQFSAVDLDHVVKECAALVDPLLSLHNVSIGFESQTQSRAYGDARAIRQIILNVLSNAVKYNVPNGRVELSLSDEREHVALSVVDTGRGMTEAQVVACVEPYKRFGEADGAGLGLSIANHLAILMGGVMTISSEVGVGTSVKLLFPKASGDTDLNQHSHSSS